MAQADTSMAIADSITEQYAGVMDDLIADCTRLEDKNADLQRQLAVAVQVRDAAIAARDQARRCRDSRGGGAWWGSPRCRRRCGCTGQGAHRASPA